MKEHMTAKFSKEWLYRENIIRRHALGLNLKSPIKWQDEDVYEVTIVHLTLSTEEELNIIKNLSNGIDTNYGKISFSGFICKTKSPSDHDFHDLCIDIEQIESVDEFVENYELVSRRKFFKKSAETMLPLLATVLLSNTLLTACNEEPEQPTYCIHCSFGCDDTCHNSCFGCGDTCKDSCSGSCQRSCKTTCKHVCQADCNTICRDACYQGCKGTCMNGCKEGCYDGNY